MVRAAAITAAGGGIALLVAGAAIGGSHIWNGYLAGAVAWTGIPLGALALIAINHLMGGGWTRAVAPALIAAARSLPVALVLFVPVLFVLGDIYPWARTAWQPGQDAKAAYLSDGFFIARSIGYFAVWLACLHFVVHGRILVADAPQHRTAASIALIAYTVTGSLAGIDWLMTLDPTFNSSIFGLLFVAGHLAAALAFAAALTFARERERPIGHVGGLLLTAALTWAYLDYMQFLVAWSADLPTETQWYLRRTDGAIGTTVTVLMVLTKAVIPIAALAWPAIRQHHGRLALVAAILVVGHLAQSAWLVLPHAEALLPAALAFAGVISLGIASALLISRTRLAEPGPSPE